MAVIPITAGTLNIRMVVQLNITLFTVAATIEATNSAHSFRRNHRYTNDTILIWIPSNFLPQYQQRLLRTNRNQIERYEPDGKNKCFPNWVFECIANVTIGIGNFFFSSSYELTTRYVVKAKE
jgi:hypothetical protein